MPIRLVDFLHSADPLPAPRLGAMLDGDGRIVDLQAAHFSMTGGPNPFLRNLAAIEHGGPHAEGIVRATLAWAASQAPPGVVARGDHVRVLGGPRELL